METAPFTLHGSPLPTDINTDDCSKPLGIYLEVPSQSRKRRKSTALTIGSDGHDAVSITGVAHDGEFEETFYDDGLFDSPRLFTELVILTEEDESNYVWSEAARWVRFEEDVEVGGQRWSKPRVSTLSLHSFFELRSFIANGMTLFDVEGNNIEEIFRNAMEGPSCANKLSSLEINKICATLKSKCVHLFDILNNDVQTIKDDGCRWRIGKYVFEKRVAAQPADSSEEIIGMSKVNKQFMKKLPEGAEAANILVGGVRYLKKHICLLIRLKNAVNLGNLTEVDVPTRFVFIYLCPLGELEKLLEVGRSIATLLSDEVFREVAYFGKTKSHILAGMDEFLDASTLLPPGEWDPDIRIEPPDAAPTKESRKKRMDSNEDAEEDMSSYLEAAGLIRTGRLFGGLINDIKRKLPFYSSDIKDAFSVQSIGAIFFLYFACLAPIVTFGGVLGETTKNGISVMEALSAGLISNVIFGLFSGQPLTIMGLTGPILVLETTVYELSEAIGWNHLSFRFWIGLWSAALLLFLVAIDASAFVSLATKFTAENFAALVALIFVYKSIEKMIMIGDRYPMHVNVNEELYCECSFPEGNETFSLNLTDKECVQMNGTLVGNGCEKFYPDVFLLSLLLFLGTFLVSMTLKKFKNGTFFPNKVRCFISDFAVITAIIIMTGIDYSCGINTPKLVVPDEFKPSLPGRGWLVDPFNGNPWWSALAAFFPALFCCMLMFVDQHITVVFLNRKEHKLKKGGGYHLDLFVVVFLVVIDSILGLPWFVSDTVCSTNHLNSLKIESEGAAPGEKPQYLGTRENRLTVLAIYTLVGLSVLITPILKYVPMPVLYGVVLFMGVVTLMGLQLFDRIMISCMPTKYQPDYLYLRKIPLKKVHLFTLIQFASLGLLWLMKSFKETAILFPLMLLLMILIRKLLENIFSQRELKILDQPLPPMRTKIRDEDKKGTIEKIASSGSIANGKTISNVASSTNMSEELYKNEFWSSPLDTNLKLPNNRECSTRSSRRSYQEVQEKSESSRQIRLHSILDPIFAPHSYQDETSEKIRVAADSAATHRTSPKSMSTWKASSDLPHLNVWCSIADNRIQLPQGYYSSNDTSRRSSPLHSRRNSALNSRRHSRVSSAILSRKSSIRHSKRSRSSINDELRQVRRNSILSPIFCHHSYELESSLKAHEDQEGLLVPHATEKIASPEELGNEEVSVAVPDFYSKKSSINEPGKEVSEPIITESYEAKISTDEFGNEEVSIAVPDFYTKSSPSNEQGKYISDPSAELNSPRTKIPVEEPCSGEEPIIIPNILEQVSPVKKVQADNE